MKKRMYFITYDDHYPSTIYDDKHFTKHFLSYEKNEREAFIKKYIYLTHNDIYFKNVKCYYIDDMIEIEDMDKVISAI